MYLFLQEYRYRVLSVPDVKIRFPTVTHFHIDVVTHTFVTMGLTSPEIRVEPRMIV